MKRLLPFLFLGLALGSCKKDTPGTAPNIDAVSPLTGNAWVWTSETTTATPKAGGAVTSRSKTVVPNTVKTTYATDGSYTIVTDKSVSSTGVAITVTGTYTYSGGTITYLTGGNTSTARVDVLTSNNLTTVSTSEDSSTRYVTTDTFAR